MATRTRHQLDAFHIGPVAHLLHLPHLCAPRWCTVDRYTDNMYWVTDLTTGDVYQVSGEVRVLILQCTKQANGDVGPGSKLDRDLESATPLLQA